MIMINILILLGLSTFAFCVFMVVAGIVRIDEKLKKISENLEILINIYSQKK